MRRLLILMLGLCAAVLTVHPAPAKAAFAPSLEAARRDLYDPPKPCFDSTGKLICKPGFNTMYRLGEPRPRWWFRGWFRDEELLCGDSQTATVEVACDARDMVLVPAEVYECGDPCEYSALSLLPEPCKGPDGGNICIMTYEDALVPGETRPMWKPVGLGLPDKVRCRDQATGRFFVSCKRRDAVPIGSDDRQP